MPITRNTASRTSAGRTTPAKDLPRFLVMRGAEPHVRLERHTVIHEQESVVSIDSGLNMFSLFPFVWPDLLLRKLFVESDIQHQHIHARLAEKCQIRRCRIGFDQPTNLFHSDSASLSD